ncbi:hypothetical protein S58_21920 [Bradyrhizobium oligotrophicum S58]|uniref:Uncharacterized protein n=1 Tax=Bradyrhizobium oligotrophicum S58 TaxID=1245469 RepID=M4Z478_9BRAD|nr:hypothetical protein [Bradyrhizobium oligotrophicum]BAM88198.1 hypothetical protein S58_21920 [Bradyrhizobium oligotrophicum S58]
MHDPVDQPSIQPSSGTPSADSGLDSAAQATAVPLIQLDQSPAIEPETNHDHAADDGGSLHENGHHKRPLATPTMWR